MSGTSATIAAPKPVEVINNGANAVLDRLDHALLCKARLDNARKKSPSMDDQFVAGKMVSMAKLEYKAARQAIKGDVLHRKHQRYDYKRHRFSVDKTGEVHICSL